MKKNYIVMFLMVCFSSEVFSEDIPSGSQLSSDQVIGNIDGKKNAYIPNTSVLPHLNIEKGLKGKMDEAKNMIQNAEVAPSENKGEQGNGKNQLVTADGKILNNIQVIDEEGSFPDASASINTNNKSKNKIRHHKKKDQVELSQQIPSPVSFKDTKEGIRFFPQNYHYIKEVTGVETVSLPSGSTAMATVLAGIEVSASETKKTYATINYAFLGPNGAVVELKDCMTWMNVSGNYTTERIYGDVSTMSCRAPNGKTFTVPIKGHMIDRKDQYIGAKGELLTRGKILASALMFLRDATTEFGKAMAAAQIRTDVVGGGENYAPKSAENVTGNKAEYIVGKSSQAAIANFMNWWVDFYTNLSPTIAIGPGAKIFVAIEEEVQIPKMFFESTLNKNELDREQKRLNTDGGVESGIKKKDS